MKRHDAEAASLKLAETKSRGFRLTGDDRRPALFVGSLTNRNASECVDPATGIENVTGMLNLIGDRRLKGRGAGIVGIKVSGLSAVNATEGYAAGDGVFAAFIFSAGAARRSDSSRWARPTKRRRSSARRCCAPQRSH